MDLSIVPIFTVLLLYEEKIVFCTESINIVYFNQSINYWIELTPHLSYQVNKKTLIYNLIIFFETQYKRWIEF